MNRCIGQSRAEVAANQDRSNQAPRATSEGSRVPSCRRSLRQLAWCALAAAGLALTGVGRAAPLTADLGDGLHFHRAHALPAELPAPSDQPGALVLDLRYAVADDGAATAFAAWLKFRAAPVFVLVNGGTASALRDVLAAEKSHPGLLTIGTTLPDFTPDIAVTITPEAERRAYDALQNGSRARELITPNADKPRMDEASIMRSRANLPEESSNGAVDDLELSDDPPPAPPAPPPPIDVALERAVQVYRALRALKRL